MYIRCTYGIFSREITLHTVIYGENIRFWPTLSILHAALSSLANVFGKLCYRETESMKGEICRH